MRSFLKQEYFLKSDDARAAMKDIRIFMCCHKQYETIPPLCKPIQCGTALNPAISGILHDNDGINISKKNREYCELTAHYFAWKNVETDYYGFCHYRRFFGTENAARRPYAALKNVSDKQLLSESELRSLCDEYDILVPIAENMGLTVKEHYNTSKYHYPEDLSLFLEILNGKAPQLQSAADSYLKQNRQYFCNMFIMNKNRFSEYCEILFSALEEFDQKKQLHGDFQSDRTDGYLGEIFTGIYITYHHDNGTKIKELPRLDAGCSVKKRINCALLPSESKRRFFIKRIVKKLRR